MSVESRKCKAIMLALSDAICKQKEFYDKEYGYIDDLLETLASESLISPVERCCMCKKNCFAQGKQPKIRQCFFECSKYVCNTCANKCSVIDCQ